MRTSTHVIRAAQVLCFAALAGCGGSGGDSPTPPGSFTLAWSEYPSWSVFGVAHEKGLIDGAAGAQGPIEERWNVDIVLKEADYDTCIQLYGSAAADAVCITNMDILAQATKRRSVAVLPTSTSAGADACIVVGIDDVKALKGHKVYGLAKSVSEYCFVRSLQKYGEKPEEYTFVNMDPEAAATAMRSGSDDVKAIVVWNPFVLQTLKDRKESKVLFNSKMIPGEIVDMVVVAQESLQKPGGKDFARAVIDTFYAINKRLEKPETRDDTLVAIGAKFSSLGLEDMKQVVQQTVFYEAPGKAVNLFTGDPFQKTMETVVTFCQNNDMLSGPMEIVYGGGVEGSAALRFDPTYIQEVEKSQQ